MSTARPGYKQTEVGVVPEVWTVEPLGALIGSLEAGVSVRSTSEATASASDSAMVLKTSCISKGRFFADEAKSILPADRARAKTSAEANTVLISRMNTPALVGEVGYVDADHPNLFLPDRLWMAKATVSKAANMRWLTAILAHGRVSKALRDTATGTSGSMKNISKPALRGLLVPTPPRNEQQAIAGALEDADGLIKAMEELIAKKRAIRQGVMQDLLIGHCRLPGFGGEWTTAPMADLFDFGRTVPLSRAQLSQEGDVKYVHYGDIHTRLHNHLDFQRTPTPGADRLLCLSATALKVGDWVFADASEDYDGVAKAVEITRLPPDRGAVAGLHTFLLRERSETFAHGFKGYLADAATFRTQVMRTATGMKVFGISKAQMKNVELRFPPNLDEQRAIAAVLSDVDAEIAALEEKRAKARAVKQGMMQVLLTGEIRLA